MSSRKKPPSQNSQAWVRDKNNELDWDGITVSDVLDYYIPEWRHVNGRIIELAHGKTVDGVVLLISVTVKRGGVTRVEVDLDRDFRSTKAVSISELKQKLLTLTHVGDAYDNDKTDKRFLMLIKDLLKKDMSN